MRRLGHPYVVCLVIALIVWRWYPLFDLGVRFDRWCNLLWWRLTGVIQ